MNCRNLGQLFEREQYLQIPVVAHGYSLPDAVTWADCWADKPYQPRQQLWDRHFVDTGLAYCRYEVLEQSHEEHSLEVVDIEKKQDFVRLQPVGWLAQSLAEPPCLFLGYLGKMGRDCPMLMCLVI